MRNIRNFNCFRIGKKRASCPYEKPPSWGELGKSRGEGKVEMTSLNSHYRSKETSTEFGSLVSRGKSVEYVIYTADSHEKSGAEAPQCSLKNE